MKRTLSLMLSALAALTLAGCAAVTARNPLPAPPSDRPAPSDSAAPSAEPPASDSAPATRPTLPSADLQTSSPVGSDRPADSSHRDAPATDSTAPTFPTAETTDSTAPPPETTVPSVHTHAWSVWVETVAPGCTAAGRQERTCTVCGQTQTEDVPAVGHHWSNWQQTKAPGCTAAGQRERTCTVCGTVEGQPVPETGHRWSAWRVIKEATVREAGERERDCTVCQTRQQEEIPIVVPTEAEKKAMALKVAREIADSIGPGTDLDRVSEAAAIVSSYCQQCVYTTEGKDYKQAYGVFVKGEYSCAGATRALGMVLECMGFEWEHVNENQWTHQWCRLVMDGQIGFADGQVGWAGYGPHPVEEW